MYSSIAHPLTRKKISIHSQLGKNIIKFRKNTFKYVLIIVVTIFVLLPYTDFTMPVHFLSDL